MYSALIIGALIFALILQVDARSVNSQAIAAGLSRGLLMAIGIVIANFALGLYGRATQLTLGQIRVRAVLSFLISILSSLILSYSSIIFRFPVATVS